jgi:hypothetical protein
MTENRTPLKASVDGCAFGVGGLAGGVVDGGGDAGGVAVVVPGAGGAGGGGTGGVAVVVVVVGSVGSGGGGGSVGTVVGTVVGRQTTVQSDVRDVAVGVKTERLTARPAQNRQIVSPALARRFRSRRRGMVGSSRRRGQLGLWSCAAALRVTLVRGIVKQVHPKR